jgi:cyclopropane fatty-acyl-phospholipid synthase-like methyltransferase
MSNVVISQLINELQSLNLKSSSDILVMGCGDGSVVRSVAGSRLFKRVVGADKTRAAIQSCRELHSLGTLSDDGTCVHDGVIVEYLIDDVEHSILANDSFDVILLQTDQLKHGGPKCSQACASAVQRLLRDDGYLFVLQSETDSMQSVCSNAAFAKINDELGRQSTVLRKIACVRRLVAEDVSVTSFEIGESSLSVMQSVTTSGDDARVDANFFDAEFTIAASTGSSVWESTWCFIDALRTNAAGIADTIGGKRVLELGCGAGALGLAAAAGVGARVLMTDIAAVVDDVCTRNIVNNSRALSSTSSATTSSAAPLCIRVNGVTCGDVWQQMRRVGSRDGGVTW